MTLGTKNKILNVLLICVSLCASYTAIEIAYRIFEYRELRHTLVNSILARIPNDAQGDSIFDVYTGYRYRANMEVGPRTLPFPVHYRTNSLGLIARENFPVRKPDGEYRIGFIGDSFTAGVMTTVRWTDIVEDRLNSSEKWQKHVKGRHTRCLNFGLDGIGVPQFGAVAEKMVRPFDVDLLVVNMLKTDIARRPYHRGFQTGVSKKQVAHYIDDLLVQLPWFGIYPDVFAVTMGGYFGMKPGLSLANLGNKFWGDRLYGTATEAAAASAASVKQILNYFPRAVFLVDRTYVEYIGAKDPLTEESFDLLAQEVPSVHWVLMNDRLPQPADETEIKSWFNLPADQHKNAKGTEMYGDAVARYLIGQFANDDTGMNTNQP